VNQGQYWSLEGAPAVPNVSGSATLADEAQIDALLVLVDKIVASNRSRALALQNESRIISERAETVTAQLEYAQAKKKLKRRCALVTFV
jgi:hypothetical protein